MTGVRIRDCQPEEFGTELRGMLQEVFPLDRKPEYWKWKYDSNPAGRAVISVAEQNGRLVSMACAMPIRMLVAGQPVLGAASVEAASRQEVRGRGIYTDVARHLYERLVDQGYALVYGFTNRNSTRVTLGALGRTEIAPFPVRLRPLRPVRLLLSKLGLSAAAGLQEDSRPVDAGVERITTLDESWDAWWESVRPHADIAAIRDARYLRWRYLDHPDRPYEILAARSGSDLAGYVVWRMVERFGICSAFVLDVGEHPSSPGVARRLLRHVADRARRRGADALSLLSWPGGPSHSVASRFSYLRLPKTLFPQPITFSVLSRRPDVASRDLAYAKRWWIGWGDSDVV